MNAILPLVLPIPLPLSASEIELAALIVNLEIETGLDSLDEKTVVVVN